MGIHARISELEKQLDAEVVLQKEEGHEETSMPDTTGDYASRWWSQESMYVVDKPAVTEPDVEKRRKARTKLINLKHSLRFFQYAARQRVEEILSIRKSSEEIELDLAFQSIKGYTQCLRAERVVQEEVGRWEEIQEILQGSYYRDGPIRLKHPIREFIVEKPEVTAPDVEKREASKKALEEVYHATKYLTAKRKIEEILGYVPEGK